MFYWYILVRNAIWREIGDVFLATTLMFKTVTLF